MLGIALRGVEKKLEPPRVLLRLVDLSQAAKLLDSVRGIGYSRCSLQIEMVCVYWAEAIVL